ncbi:class I SAM-dependent methyltransferase [Ectopseudomonas hydrolytica]|jgi:ubiquinone/menaquinone biosynthesis C-methylase UbiE|uniref:Methyltransferase type 11 n=1 Tax=Ectopseudomonas mendocina (strain ymp) TaxID=399739 RepID=A4XYZ6_ECTM1|nr:MULTISPECIES: class I SAM-dependent methyltransferase [Pseudomonas]ARS50613.1 phospholipid methyltransferase [Pseudomonas mendocina]EJO95520.1 type 11 methyltransferase [Pseudomonas mendocina DLHK]MBF8162819.1 class I SAM-dependent methyltransferase [Pseudomonas mendocina]UTH30987.1 class I SAM-dependent methyltransferase [Pseudomonas hydrolytica]UTH35830.1 class I SAM-dependent methyltransferase [Pseudomonas sp. KHPS1]
MGLYDRHILPHLIDFACGMGAVMKARSQIVPLARGRVLEIGIGSGLNLGFYDAQRVEVVVGVDPSAEMQALARERAARCQVPVEMIALELGQIQAADASFDDIVCTFTLCTIPDAIAALGEMRRVLKPGGRLLFCEHGLAPDLPVVRWQKRLTPLWKPLAGGCHLDRDIPALIEAGGFHIREMSTGYLKGPRPMTHVYRGWAD